MTQRIFETSNTTILKIGSQFKVVKITLIERIGQAVLNGASEEEIEAIRRAHFSKATQPS